MTLQHEYMHAILIHIHSYYISISLKILYREHFWPPAISPDGLSKRSIGYEHIFKFMKAKTIQMKAFNNMDYHQCHLYSLNYSKLHHWLAAVEREAAELNSVLKT